MYNHYAYHNRYFITTADNKQFTSFQIIMQALRT